MTPSQGCELSAALATAGRVVFHVAGAAAAEHLSSSSKITVIGQLDEVRAAAAGLHSSCTPLLEDVKVDTKATAAVQTEVFFEPTTKRRITCVCVPPGVGRNTAHSRPDLVYKALAGKLSGSGVLIASAKVVDAVAVALAVARCSPPLSLKSDASSDGSDIDVAFASAGVDAETVGKVQVVADAIRATQLLVDAPPCRLNAATFEAFVREQLADVKGVQVEVICGEELAAKGMGGMHGVGKAAAVPPRMLILTHNADATGQSVCLVGKGIVYDTGGLSIKNTLGMCGMKFDMGGAAAQFGAFLAASRVGGIGAPLHCVLCLAENAVSEHALRNDDVITMYSGLTVEVNNTDCEGRLVLGDGVAYCAKHLSPRLVVDMATLTGAQGITTGLLHSALYCNDDALERRAVAAGLASGDYCFPILYAPELHLHELKSQIADMKNSVKNRSNAQSSCAGSFILRQLFHSGYSGPALHIDMAYPAESDSRATGYGVALISKLLDVI